MSRVGKYPVDIPDGVDVSLADNVLTAKGKLGELTVPFTDDVTVEMKDGKVVVTPNGNGKKARAMWGTVRSLVSNAVVGVSEGFTKRLEINGVGYRAQVQGKKLNLQLGYSHDIPFEIPEGITIKMEGDRQAVIAVSGADRQQVGQVASVIRGYRSPEPYKGKGVKYADEYILRKEGKKK
jgi:large subunit ribosomal protein L6